MYLLICSSLKQTDNPEEEEVEVEVEEEEEEG